MRIRSVEQHEVERLRELRLRALREDPTAFGSSYADEVDRTLPEWLWWVDPPSVTFIADDGETWQGLAVGRLDEDSESLADVFSMWVVPEARGKGLGGMLLDRVVEWAWASGVTTVRLAVTEGNEAAQALYLHRGFEPTGRRELLASNRHLMCDFMELRRI